MVLWLQERHYDVPQNLRILALSRQDYLKIFDEGLSVSDINSLPLFLEHPKSREISSVHTLAKREADDLAEYDRRVIDAYYRSLGLGDIFKILRNAQDEHNNQ